MLQANQNLILDILYCLVFLHILVVLTTSLHKSNSEASVLVHYYYELEHEITPHLIVLAMWLYKYKIIIIIIIIIIITFQINQYLTMIISQIASCTAFLDG